MKKTLLHAVLLAGLLAEKPATLDAQRHCLADELAARNAVRFPELAAKRADLQAKMDVRAEQLLQNPPSPDRSVVTIPVVVHVVYKFGSDNISQSQIQSQIDVLNQDFRKKNANAGMVPADFKPFAADMEIEFCLASTDPDGKATTGITRTKTDVDNIGNVISSDGRQAICYTSLGGRNAWDSKRYLNMWVGRIGNGLLGFATFPGTAPASEDGVVVDPRFFGTVGLAAQNPPHHLGRTTTHEVGHFLNLRHIWGDNGSICDDDDGVGDTPKQRTSYEDCPAHPQFSCGFKAMFMNYMDYTDDPCMSLFTEGQKARALAALQVSRPGLLTSAGCSTVSAADELAENDDLKIFPNPATDELRVEIPENAGEPLAWTVGDFSGKICRSVEVQAAGRFLDFSIGGLPSGWYFVKIQTAERVLTAVFSKI